MGKSDKDNTIWTKLKIGGVVVAGAFLLFGGIHLLNYLMEKFS